MRRQSILPGRARQQEPKDIASVARKQRERRMPVPSWLTPFHLCQSSSPLNGATHTLYGSSHLTQSNLGPPSETSQMPVSMVIIYPVKLIIKIVSQVLKDGVHTTHHIPNPNGTSTPCYFWGKLCFFSTFRSLSLLNFVVTSDALVAGSRDGLQFSSSLPLAC